MKPTSLLALIVSIGLFAAPASASIQVYTNQADFLAAIQPGYYLENFQGLPTGSLSSQQNFSGSDFSFQASSNSNLYVNDYAGDRVLSIAFAASTVTIGSLDGPTPVTALGGYFFMGRGEGPAIAPIINPDGVMSITATNGVDSAIHSLTAPTTVTTFVGFISTTGALTELSFVRTSDTGTGFISTNDFIVGTATVQDVVPEAGSLLVWGGIAVTVLLGRRKSN